MMPWLSLGLLLALAGSLAFYLASPNQRWRRTPLPARPTCVAGASCLLAALLALAQAMQPVVAVYSLLTWLMLLWILLPYLGALLGHTEPRKKDA